MNSPESRGVGLVIISQEVTGAETRHTLASRYMSDELRGIFQSALAEATGATSVQSELVYVRHKGGVPHPSHLQIKWDLVWDHKASIPPRVEEDVREGRNPSRPLGRRDL